MLNKELSGKIDKFYDILNRGFYCSANEVVETFNTVFPNEKMRFTTCSSCLRKAVLKMVAYKDKLSKITNSNDF